MEVLELTIMASRRRPVAQYAMDDTTATMRIAIPRDADVAGLIVEARRVLERGLDSETGTPTTQAKAPPHKPWRVEITGARITHSSALSRHGFTLNPHGGGFVGYFATQAEAITKGTAAEMTVAGTKASPPTREAA